MVLVMLGTQNNSFVRLLEEVQKCIDNKIINDDVIVQAGNTKFKTKDMKLYKIMSAKKLVEYINQADFVICHGGVGSIVTALKQNKKVIAVARQKKYNEHVNDHQMQIVEAFTAQGFIKGITEVRDLEKAIKELPEFEPIKFVSNNEHILGIIEDFIDNN
ncbi:MAG: exopolysaccharide biosynthesis protein [Clostridia bacterium]|nr:exopolysaccharide biosynthesis protein [Clostridia bacterium]